MADETPSDVTQVQVGPPPPPTFGMPTIPGYDLLREIGRGGMGVVYEARQTKLDRIVALKLMLGDDPLNKARFLAEGQVIAAVKHPQVVEVYDFGESNAGPYIAMEYLTGGTLGDRIKAGLTFLPKEAADIIAKVASGVGAAHDLGIVHRDLKPGNVLIDAHGSPKVTDFGLAKRTKSELTRTQDAAGTPAYMAPEQAKAMKFVGPPADVWSLGVMLYEALLGKRPFVADSDMELMIRIQNDNPTTLRTVTKSIPHDLETVCLKCLEKDPDRRYVSAKGLAADLAAWGEGKPIAARRSSQVEKAAMWVRRKPTLAVAWCLGLLVPILITFAITSTTFWNEAARARDLLEVEKGQAEKAREGEAKAKEQLENALDNVARAEYARTIYMAHLEYLNDDIPRARQLLSACKPDYRGWEWDYVQRLCHGDILTLVKTKDRINSVCFNTDGSRVAASVGKIVMIWDSHSGAVLHNLKGHALDVVSVSFSRDGKLIVSSGEDGIAILWNAITGKEIVSYYSQENKVETSLVSPDNSTVTSVTDTSCPRLWSIATGKLLFELEGYKNEKEYGKIPGTQIRLIPFGDGREKKVVSYEYSTDGAMLLVGYTSGQVIVYDPKSGQQLHTLADKVAKLRHAVFSPLGKQIITMDQDGQVVSWEVRTGKQISTTSLAVKFPACLTVSSDGLMIGTGEKSVASIWDAKTGQELQTIRGHEGPVTSIHFSPDNSQIATGSRDGTVKIWSTKTGPLTFRASRFQVYTATFSHDNNRILTGGGAGEAIVWDPDAGQMITYFKNHTGFICSSHFSNDDKYILTGSHDNTARLWNSNSGEQLSIFRPGLNDKCVTAYSPNGSNIATIGAEGPMLWNTKDGNAIMEFKASRHRLQALSFNTDGSKLIGDGADGEAVIWDVRDGKQIRTLRGHKENIKCLQYSYDDSRILTGSWDSTAKVWNADLGLEVYTLRGHKSAVTSACFNRSGTRIVTASYDGSFKIWDGKTGLELLTLHGKHGKTGEPGTIHCASFSPDGTRIVTGGEDGIARIWDSRPVNRDLLKTATGKK